MTKTLGRISSEESMGLVDGPGIRYVVFLQGCMLRCKYCHNPETWDINRKCQSVSAEDLIKKIERYKSYFGDEGGVTFSGGEPLLQPQFLIECLKLCKEKGMKSVRVGCYKNNIGSRKTIINNGGKSRERKDTEHDMLCFRR